MTRLSRPGANSDWGRRQVTDALRTSAGEFELLIVEFSINDASLYHGVPLRRSAANLDAILAAGRHAGMPVVLATMNPAWGQKGLERLGQTAYRELLRERTEPGQVAVLDTVALWHSLPENERPVLMPDGLHPSAEGMRRVHLPALYAALAPYACSETR